MAIIYTAARRNNKKYESWQFVDKHMGAFVYEIK